MASIRKQIEIDAPADEGWDAVRDFGAAHTRHAAGVVVDTQLDGDDRIVTFVTGAVQREPFVDRDDEARRLVYSAVDSPMGAIHYNAAMQVFPRGDGRSRIEWQIDFLPHGIHDRLAQAMDAGAQAMQRT